MSNIMFIILKELNLIFDPNKQLDNADKLKASTGNQEINVFADNFKFTQTLKFNHWFRL